VFGLLYTQASAPPRPASRWSEAWLRPVFSSRDRWRGSGR
jgi:hypothetical protein